MELIPMRYNALTINYNSRHQTNKIHKFEVILTVHRR